MQWQDVLSDKTLRDLPYKIELNNYGKIELSPASFVHSLLQGEIAKRLGTLANGRVFTELAIQTHSGVRVPDVAWGSIAYTQQHIRQVFASDAPEICVEIISPSNFDKEIQEKIKLFINAGAIEVWLVQESGCVDYYDKTGKLALSRYDVDLQKLI